MSAPLEGLRVIECGLWIAGPWAAMMLGDLGAEVIKLEDPVEGDTSRGLTAMLGQSMAVAPGRSVVYEANNRNKKSMTLDLKSPESREVMRRLVANSDIFVHNMAPGVPEGLGVGYEDLAPHNPRLIYGAISGYGPVGPEADRRGMELTVLGRSGFQDAVTVPGQSPHYVQGTGDITAGAMLSIGLLAALAARERTGVGQRVDASVLGSLVRLQDLIINSHYFTGPGFPRFDRLTVSNPMTNTYRCSDGKWLWVCLAQPERFWGRFCIAIGAPHLENDPRFDTAEKRAQDIPALVSILDEIFAGKTCSEWLAIFSQYPDFLYEAVQSVHDLDKDPQVLANNYIVEAEHPALGKRIKTPGVNISLSQTPASIRSMPPEHGQHTEEVLLEVCGYSWDEVAELKNAKVV